MIWNVDDCVMFCLFCDAFRTSMWAMNPMMNGGVSGGRAHHVERPGSRSDGSPETPRSASGWSLVLWSSWESWDMVYGCIRDIYIYMGWIWMGWKMMQGQWNSSMMDCDGFWVSSSGWLWIFHDFVAHGLMGCQPAQVDLGTNSTGGCLKGGSSTPLISFDAVILCSRHVLPAVGVLRILRRTVYLGLAWSSPNRWCFGALWCYMVLWRWSGKASLQSLEQQLSDLRWPGPGDMEGYGWYGWGITWISSAMKCARWCWLFCRLAFEVEQCWEDNMRRSCIFTSKQVARFPQQAALKCMLFVDVCSHLWYILSLYIIYILIYGIYIYVI